MQRKETKNNKMNKPAFLIFSGHNDRAVVALCRFFQRTGNSFVIISSGATDPIRRTDWSKNVVFCRLSKRIELSLFERALAASGEQAVIYCPTTEFMNQFVLENRERLEQVGVVVPLCSNQLYAQLTSKFESVHLVQELAGIAPPSLFGPDPQTWRAPCVIKPRVNTDGQQVFYPKLCATAAELHSALSSIQSDQWFCQEWVEGQSYYLCAYVSKQGELAYFWQENVLQQSGGKSIVLARSIVDPDLGIDEKRFLGSLRACGFSGAFMMEVIKDPLGHVHYIEINPRFWGPLQLALTACPRLLSLFVADWGGKPLEGSAQADHSGAHWYGWLYGASSTSCRAYPAATTLGTEVSDLLVTSDVYRPKDTAALHGVH